MENVIDFINVNRDQYLDELKAFLAIPSISALPQHAGDVRRCADWCGDEMRRIEARSRSKWALRGIRQTWRLWSMAWTSAARR